MQIKGVFFRLRLLAFCAGVAVLVLPFLSLSIRTVDAQGSEWSKPYLLFETQGAVYMTSLVADPAGNVHAVWESRSTSTFSGVQSDSAIYYSVLDSSTGVWSRPVDILFEPGGLRFPNLVIGADGRLHLFATGSCLIHASASLNPFPQSSSLWKNQGCIADPSFEFGAATDKRGNLHLAYTDQPPYRVLYRASLDSGQTWSQQSIVWQAEQDTAVNNAQLAVSSDGVIHVVWAEYPLPEAYPPNGVFYSQSLDGGKSWTLPRRLAGVNYTEPRIITQDREVHVLINGAGNIGSRYHIYSSDDGRTWSEIEVAIKASAGMLGPPDGVFDSLGHLHMVAGTNEGVRYSQWNGQSWSAPEVLFTPAYKPDVDTGHPSIVLTRGNQLHAIYRDLDKRIYYSTKTISAPYVPSAGLPTQPAETPTSIPTVVSPANPTPVPIDVDAPDSSSQSTALPLILGVGMSVLVIVLSLVVKTFRRG